MERALLLLALAGCSDAVRSAPDLSAAPADFSVYSGAAQLFSKEGGRPLDAYYSTWYEPRAVDGPHLEMVISLVDPQFRCVGPVPSGVELLALLFLSRYPGVESARILARGGPILGPTSASDGSAELIAVDDRASLTDGGVQVGADGRVDGKVDFQLAGDVAVRGLFSAVHCPAFDFVVPD